MCAMDLSNVRIVLVSPLYGGNIGSVCRMMANMGLNDLAITSPRKVDEQEARMMACSAYEIYKTKKEFNSLAEAVADRTLVAGTSARLGLYRSHSSTPRGIAEEIAGTAQTQKVAIVFGPEDSGLQNEDLSLCTHIIQIPSTKEYTSLNLAQAVAVCCYEIYVASGAFEPSEEKSPPATSEFRERMYDIWRDALLEIGFMQDEKADHMMMGLRRVLARGIRTEDDVKIMMGVAKQSVWAAREKGSGVE
jgi:TrmH family RNA methyltransferase